MSHRREQLASTLKRALSQVLARELSDPRVPALVSVTRVQVSPDLREAQVYVSVLPAGAQHLALQGLQHARGHIQSRLGRLVRLQRLPQLGFRLDDSLKRSAEVYQAIARGVARDASPPTTQAGAAPPPAGPDMREADGS